MSASEAPAPRRALAHVGITVPDLDHGVDWFSRVLGFDVIVPAHSVVRDDRHAGDIASDVLGSRFRAMRQAHLAAANGAGIELFEFVDPRVTPARGTGAWWATGPWHVCIVDPDVKATVAAICRQGGSMRSSRVWRLFADEPYEMAYCADPFGNLIEIYSHSYERIYSNRDLG
jgi:catechol 2,3-dioxygenase-like lactoylglutathione lyase family enzyme